MGKRMIKMATEANRTMEGIVHNLEQNFCQSKRKYFLKKLGLLEVLGLYS